MSATEKNIYSLVLSDDVVEAVDRLARSSGLSRSAMVNQLLAERVCCVTPEMRLKSITSAILSAVGGEFYLTEQPSAATVACKTALKYRYKPTLRYSVELFGAGSKRAGELRITVRTQSSQLYADLSGFFRCWTELEQKYIAGRISQDILFAIEPGRFTRTLNMPPEGIPDEALGQRWPGFGLEFKGNVDDFLQNTVGHHYVLCFGDWAQELKYMADIYGIGYKCYDGI